MRTVYTALADHARLTERAIERLVNAPLVLGVGLDSIHREITPAPALEREPPEWRLLCFLLAQRYQLGLSRAIETRLEESLPTRRRPTRTPSAIPCAKSSAALARCIACWSRWRDSESWAGRSRRLRR
jgi:hypothetical protein